MANCQRLAQGSAVAGFGEGLLTPSGEYAAGPLDPCLGHGQWYTAAKADLPSAFSPCRPPNPAPFRLYLPASQHLQWIAWRLVKGPTS